jgi:hypothetical protein
MKLTFKQGDATRPEENAPYWILHGCNNQQAWGAGFVIGLNKTFGIANGSPMKEYWRWFEEPLNAGDFPPTLGDIQFVKVDGGNMVVNMITQKGCGPVYCKKIEIGIPFRYEAFAECLYRVKVHAELLKDKSGKYPTLVAPRIGCGLAGALFECTQDVIEEVFTDIDIEYVVYDLPPKGAK